MAAGVVSGSGVASSRRPRPVRTSTPRAPTACAGAEVVPAIADDERSRRDRCRDPSPRGAASPAAASGSRTPFEYASTDAGRVVRAVIEPVDAARHRALEALSAICRCASATNDSLTMPRAMPAWLVMTMTSEARAIEHPHRVHGVGKEHQPLEAIEVSGLFDERPVAIEEHGSRHGEVLSHGVQHGVGVNSFHAAVIDRALTQHARPAEHVPDDEIDPLGVGRPATVTRSSVGPNIAVSGTPSAAATCIAPESFDTKAAHRATTPTSCAQARAADQVHDPRARRQRRFYRTPRVAVGAGADKDRGHVLRRQARDHLGDAIRWPAFRVSVRRAGRKPHELRARRHAGARAAALSAFSRVCACADQTGSAQRAPRCRVRAPATGSTAT